MIQRIVKRLFDYKRDYRDNNQTETQGPPGSAGATGPQGPAGSQGIQGLPGPNQILTSSLYTVIGPPSNTNSGSFINSLLNAIQGDSVVSGGNAMITPRTGPFAIFDQPLQTLDGWITSVAALSENQSIFIQTLAICFDKPPLRP